jgi:hypothetical protein
MQKNQGVFASLSWQEKKKAEKNRRCRVFHGCGGIRRSIIAKITASGEV